MRLATVGALYKGNKKTSISKEQFYQKWGGVIQKVACIAHAKYANFKNTFNPVPKYHSKIKPIFLIKNS